MQASRDPGGLAATRRSIRRLAAALGAAALLSCTGLTAGAHATAPDPGGDEHADITLPPAGKVFGFNGLFNVDGSLTDGLDTTAQAALMRQAGASSARMPLQWWGVEGQRDLWNEAVFTRHALAYTELRLAGIRPHFILQHAPPWARDEGDPKDCADRDKCHYPPARAMLGEWREFVAEVASRFPHATLEIWNEPNHFGQWRSGVDPARYAELLAAADEAASGSRVYMGGMAAGASTASMGPVDFLDAAYAASPSLKGHTEVINFHTYPFGRLGEGTPFAKLFEGIRTVRASYGDAGTPLFVSETGSTTSGPLAVSGAEQSDSILRAARKMLTMDDVSGVLVHTLLDRHDRDPESHEYGFGVLEETLTLPAEPKRAYCQLTRASQDLYSLCPPLARITGGPSGPTNDPSPEFEFAASEPPAGFECALDGDALSSCASPFTSPALEEGQHRFAVRAIGSDGRRDPDPATREFTVDVTPPHTSLSGTSGPTSDSTPTFYPTTPDTTAKVECSLDGGQFETCTSPHTIGPLADGTYELRARAVDPAGNRDPSPSASSFRVDTRAPNASIVSGPNGPTKDRQPRFEFEADEEGSRFLCAFDGKDLEQCREPEAHYPAGNLVDGHYSIEVAAIDAAGNRGPKDTRAFEVDGSGPTASIEAPPTPGNDPTPTFGLDPGEQGATIECRIDPAAFEPCPASFTAPTLPDGHHAIEARGVDQLGNVGPVARHVFRIDTRPPGVYLTAPVPTIVNTTSVDLWFAADEAGAQLQCSLDWAAWSGCSSPWLVSGLADGAHVFRIRAIDAAGNVSATPLSRWITVDTTAPTVTITLGPSGPTQQVTPTFSFSADDAGATAECRFDDAPFAACSAPSSHQPAQALAEGPHTFAVRAVDNVGNVGAAAQRSFTVDRTAPATPEVTLKGTRDGVHTGLEPVKLSVGTAEDGLALRCSLNGSPWEPCSSSPAFGDLPEGRHAVYVQAIDAAANYSLIASRQLTVDRTAPETAIERKRRNAFALSSNEATADFRCSLDRKRFRKCSALHKLKRLDRGKHLLRVRAVDAASNRDASPARLRFRIG